MPNLRKLEAHESMLRLYDDVPFDRKPIIRALVHIANLLGDDELTAIVHNIDGVKFEGS